jgi:hypothetical protein
MQLLLAVAVQEAQRQLAAERAEERADILLAGLMFQHQ